MRWGAAMRGRRPTRHPQRTPLLGPAWYMCSAWLSPGLRSPAAAEHIDDLSHTLPFFLKSRCRVEYVDACAVAKSQKPPIEADRAQPQDAFTTCFHRTMQPVLRQPRKEPGVYSQLHKMLPMGLQSSELCSSQATLGSTYAHDGTRQVVDNHASGQQPAPPSTGPCRRITL